MKQAPARPRGGSTAFFASPLAAAAVAILLALPLRTALAVDTISPAAARDSEKEESFAIDGTTYIIPKPWAGNRIQAPSQGEMAFAQVPLENCANGSKIFVETETRDALVQMMAAAKLDDIHLEVNSGYRSRRYQKQIFTRMLNSGRDSDDIIRYVAPPGYSEHALGMAVDFHPSNWEFAALPAYQWLRENAHIFGFAETYGRTKALGYPWEAWHWAYTPPPCSQHPLNAKTQSLSGP